MNCKIIILGIVIFVLLVLVYYICSKTFKYYSNKNNFCTNFNFLAITGLETKARQNYVMGCPNS